MSFVVGLVFILATYTLSIPALNTEDIGKALEWLFLIFFPNYCLGMGLMDMYTNAGYNDICDSYNYKTLCNFGSNPCCFPGEHTSQARDSAYKTFRV